MDTVVLKFGGSSVADNIRLNVVAEKIIDFYKNGNKVVVVVSAQGKTTDELLKEAGELSAVPIERELDVLLSSGEQISMSKLSILLNRLGYSAISLTGWQAGIFTNAENQNASIETIDTSRIERELEEKRIVIIAGFQGLNEKGDITTLGRGGSDTTAVAVAAALKAKHCYIFSDVDGVYTTDPNKITEARKLQTLSYEEMMDIADEGAKVLHNRCVEIAQKFEIPIVTKSTFNNKQGTTIHSKIEGATIKSIVKNDDIIFVQAKNEMYSISLFQKVYQILLANNLEVNNLVNNSKYALDISFTIKASSFNKFTSLLDKELNMLDCTYVNISKIAIIGNGINHQADIMDKIMGILKLNKLEILNMQMGETKITILFKEKLPNTILEQFHHEILE